MKYLNTIRLADKQNKKNDMANDFQIWLMSQGYYRNETTGGAWYKDGNIVTGKELNDKLNDWKLINE